MARVSRHQHFLRLYNFPGHAARGFVLAWLPVVYLASLFDHGILTLILSTFAALLIGIIYAILARR